MRDMSRDRLRENLVELLLGGSAHITVQEALRGIDPKLRNVRPAGMRSVWEVLEHMRIAQEDILRYTLDPNWRSPEFPEGYWPEDPQKMTEGEWSKTLDGFLADLEEVIRLVRDEGTDLLAEIPHGEGRTYLREVLLVADHNSYHLGQIVQIRKALGDWPD
jgi:uncharacterized damage-inducible protein DinB